MFRIDVPTAAIALPAPAAPGAEGYFSAGNPGTGTPATVVSADWLNMMQEELRNIAALKPGFVDSKNTYNQAAAAITYLIGAGGRIPLLADATFYVSTAGNDGTGDGTLAKPWLTGQHAIDVISKGYDTRGFNVTIQFADGTYNGNMTINQALTGQQTPENFKFIGNVATPGNVKCGGIAQVQNNAMCNWSGFQMQGAYGFGVTSGGQLDIGAGMVYGPITNYSIDAAGGGIINIGSNFSVTGGSQGLFVALGRSTISIAAGITITLTGTPAFATTALALDGSLISMPASTVFTGAATGQRFNVASNSVIDTGTGNASFLPGNASGIQASGGQYL